MKDKPLDHQLLDRFARGAQLPIGDIGTGPGHVARYLHDRGVPAFGIDISPRMVKQARNLNPGIEFWQENMLALDAPDNAWGGITAFNSIIHVPRPGDRCAAGIQAGAPSGRTDPIGLPHW
jgi:trans-aconitate methyltransferase